jgi:hypothetical protein
LANYSLSAGGPVFVDIAQAERLTIVTVATIISAKSKIFTT